MPSPPCALLVLEEKQGRLLELDGDLGDALGEALAGADVEGDSGPAPVFDLEAEGGVGLGLGARVDAVFLAVADDGLAVDGAGAVLAADGVGGVDGGDGLPDLDLFGADGGGLEGDGRLHGDEAEELHDVVLDDVAKGSGGLVEGAAAFDADGLGSGDLDVVDVVAVPDVLEDAVGEAEDEDVLDGLFAEVVVDAEDLVFVEDLVDFVVEGAGGFEVVAEGLLDDGADPGFAAVGGCLSVGLGHAVLAEVVDDVGEVLGRGGEVEEAVAAGVELLVELGELGLERVVAGWVVEVHGVVLDAVDEGGELGIGLFDAASADDAFLHVGGEGVLEGAAGYADDGEVLRGAGRPARGDRARGGACAW